MELHRLKSIIESLVLVSEEPISANAIALMLEPDGVTKADIETAIGEIKARHNDDPSAGFYLAEVAGGFQFRTKTENALVINKLNVPKPSKLSQPSLETLAIIAYKQPIVRSEIEEIRGVDSGGVLKTLLERNLVRIIGKRDDPGNPLIYGTTTEFLEMFSLGSLKELPTLREFEELEKEYYKGEAKTENAEAAPQLLDSTIAAPFEQKWTVEDEGIINDLADGIKKLRRLEKDIFPKPVEELIAVPKDEGVGVASPSTEDTGTSDKPV